jgi:competence protein ComGC
MTPRRVKRFRNRRGFALVAVLMIAMVATVLALATSMLTMSNKLVQVGSDRAAAVDDAAIGALEMERSRLNARLDSIPVDGYLTVADGEQISGTNIRRTIWVSRLGNSDSLRNAGEFGVQAEVVAKAEDSFGNVAIRRSQLFQESFARYASFTDIARSTNGSLLYWALGAQAQGPVHSNDTINVWSGATPNPQVTFHDVVTTARIVTNKTKASFKKGPPKERISRIPMPTTADLNILKNIASRAGYVFTPNVVTGDSALATMRIEFVAIDADGDGNTTGPDDGYFKVYQLYPALTFGAGYTMARTPVPVATAPKHTGASVSLDSMLYSRNCGVTAVIGGRTAIPARFIDVAINAGGANYQAKMQNRINAFDNVNARCFLGGDDRLSPTGLFRATDSAGYWMPRTSGGVPGTVAARPDGAYLWPLSAASNPSFRGVIFAEGKVAISGVVRGRVTVASRNTLVLVHELTQATSPGIANGNCRADDDVIGLFSGEYVMYADNTLATPQWRRTNSDGSGWTWPRKDFDPSASRPDMAIHASLLALRSVAAERSKPPSGLAANRFVTRGTTRLIGGTIEQRIGQTGTMSGSYLHGYYDDLSFNRCLLQYPPPYFPTTGRWSRSQYYEVNPNNFSPSTWFSGR